jgi:hypothetical protein
MVTPKVGELWISTVWEGEIVRILEITLTSIVVESIMHNAGIYGKKSNLPISYFIRRFKPATKLDRYLNGYDIDEP